MWPPDGDNWRSCPSLIRIYYLPSPLPPLYLPSLADEPACCSSEVPCAPWVSGALASGRVRVRAMHDGSMPLVLRCVFPISRFKCTICLDTCMRTKGCNTQTCRFIFLVHELCWIFSWCGSLDILGVWNFNGILFMLQVGYTCLWGSLSWSWILKCSQMIWMCWIR
jgi:hypothetical protein